MNPPPNPLIVVWSLDDLENPQVIDYPGNMGGTVFLPDSKFLAWGDQDGYITLKDLETGKEHWRQKVIGQWSWALAVSHRGNLFAAPSFDGNVSLWRLDK
jgi:WD40 repeat protein